MRRQERSSVVTTVAIPASVLAASDLAAEYLPPLSLVADAELEKMGARGQAELERREAQRTLHIAAGRAVYVYQLPSANGAGSFWCVSRKRQGRERDQDGRLLGNVAQGPHDGVRLAQMILEQEDKGGVIYVDSDWVDDKVVDVRPSECPALTATGQHDWFYVPTGDDVCRSCGLVS